MATPLAPPVLEQPAPREASYGLVTGIAPRGAYRLVVTVRGHVLASRSLRRRHFAIRVSLPTGELTLRVTTIARDHRRSVAVIHDVLGLPRAALPSFRTAHEDAVLTRRVRVLARRYRGISGIYLQSLNDGAGAAWNARARFPAASTLKLAIATTVLAAEHGVPARGSYLDGLLHDMLVVSDNASANALEVWLGGSTSGGSTRVNALMRSIGLRDTIMYGGYEIGTYARRIPLEVEEQPSFGFGKYTTAWDLAKLFRAIWLASSGRGPLRTTGFTTADARYLLWLLAHVRDSPKLDRIVRRSPDVVVLHKAGWIDSARHDAGLVFWRGGVFVASVMTWDPRGAGVASDVLAGGCANAALVRLRLIHR
jgi:beta-lactamase class A